MPVFTEAPSLFGRPGVRRSGGAVARSSSHIDARLLRSLLASENAKGLRRSCDHYRWLERDRIGYRPRTDFPGGPCFVAGPRAEAIGRGGDRVARRRGAGGCPSG